MSSPSCPERHLSQPYIFAIHLIVALFFTYLGYMIVTKKQLNYGVGVLLLILAVAVLAVQSYYLYLFYNNKN